MNRRFALLLTIIGILYLPLLAAADEPPGRVSLPGESAAGARRLAAIDQLAADGRWAEAVEEYRRLGDEAGQELVPVHAGLSLQARKLCHLRLSALPADALRLYRTKVDARAKRWLEQAEAEHDPRWLRKIVEEAFGSRSGDRALDRLGDQAFERGDFDEAERWWRLLVAPAHASAPLARRADAAPLALAFPDPQVDVARVRAKQILARLFRGERADVPELLTAYRAVHGQAEGRLAGRQGRYADILKALAAADVGTPRERPWPTFAGAPTRNPVMPQAPRRLDQPTWTWPLDEAGGRDKRVETLTARARRLAFHPLVLDNQVLVADARSVTAFDLATGARAWDYLLGGGKNGGVRVPAKMAVPDVRYTLTAAGNHVYARLGAQAIGPRKEGAAARLGNADSFLVCLRRRPDADGRRECWVRRPERATEVFEGAPLVQHGRVYLAVTRVTGANRVTAVACYDAVTGEPRWRQPVDVCEVQDLHPTSGRRPHHLLTLAGPYLIYNSHAGAVVALEAATGRRAWAARYPSRGDRLEDARPSPRDLAPCVYAAGRLFVAPADCGRIFCLDSETGQRLWEGEPPVEAVHLLGVAQGRLVFTTAGDVRAVSTATGRTLWVSPPLRPFGRGVLAGDWVLCPTEAGLRVLELEHGQPVADAYNYIPNDVRGNLAIGDGCLVTADVAKLHAYVPPRRLLEERRRMLDEEPTSATARYGLALAEADAGQYGSAVQDLARVEREADPAEHVAGVPLRGLARRRRYQVLSDWAAEAQARKRWGEAADHLTQAAAAEFSVSERVEAITRQATLWTQAGRPEKAVSAWQTVLEDDALRGGVVEQGGAALTFTGAGRLASRRISDLIGRHGADVYAAVEERARALVDEAPEDQRAAVLEQLGRRFPHAAVTAAGRRPRLSAGRPRLGAAEMALKFPWTRTWQIALPTAARLLVPDDEPAFAGLGRLFFTHGTAPHITVTCRAAATGKRLWETMLSYPPSWLGRHADIILIGGADGACGLSQTDGRRLWEFSVPADFEGRPGEAADHAGRGQWQAACGRLFFLCQGRLFELDAASGEVLWGRWAPGARWAFRETQAAAGRFHPFFHAGERRVAVQTSGGRLWVLDSQTGRTLHDVKTAGDPWPQPPLVLAGGCLCLVTGPEQVALFDPSSGKEVWSHPTGKPSISGAAPQVAGAGQALLVLCDGWRLERLDPRTGEVLWAVADPRWLSKQWAEPWAAGLDRAAVYFVRRNVLYAHALADGKRLWARGLDEVSDPQRVMPTPHALIVWPQLEARRTPGSFSREAPWRDFPILVCDPEDGQLIQSLNFTAHRSELSVLFVGQGAAVSAGGMAWGLGFPGEAQTLTPP
jgi:outer membrane protein assembly factor BamB